jgi:hypothetical protein
MVNTWLKMRSFPQVRYMKECTLQSTIKFYKRNGSGSLEKPVRPRMSLKLLNNKIPNKLCPLDATSTYNLTFSLSCRPRNIHINYPRIVVDNFSGPLKLTQQGSSPNRTNISLRHGVRVADTYCRLG